MRAQALLTFGIILLIFFALTILDIRKSRTYYLENLNDFSYNLFTIKYFVSNLYEYPLDLISSEKIEIIPKNEFSLFFLGEKSTLICKRSYYIPPFLLFSFGSYDTCLYLNTYSLFRFLSFSSELLSNNKITKYSDSYFVLFNGNISIFYNNYWINFTNHELINCYKVFLGELCFLNDSYLISFGEDIGIVIFRSKEVIYSDNISIVRRIFKDFGYDIKIYGKRIEILSPTNVIIFLFPRKDRHILIKKSTIDIESIKNALVYFLEQSLPAFNVKLDIINVSFFGRTYFRSKPSILEKNILSGNNTLFLVNKTYYFENKVLNYQNLRFFVCNLSKDGGYSIGTYIFENNTCISFFGRDFQLRKGIYLVYFNEDTGVTSSCDFYFLSSKNYGFVNTSYEFSKGIYYVVIPNDCTLSFDRNVTLSQDIECICYNGTYLANVKFYPFENIYYAELSKYSEFLINKSNILPDYDDIIEKYNLIILVKNDTVYYFSQPCVYNNCTCNYIIMKLDGEPLEDLINKYLKSNVNYNFNIKLYVESKDMKIAIER